MVGKAFANAKKHAEDNKSQQEDVARGKFRGLVVLNGEPARVRFLHEPSKAVDLYIHYWRGGTPTRVICKQAHYGQECDICNLNNSFGEPCYPTYVRCFISFAYSNLGKTWMPKRGKNKGKKQAVNPRVIVDVPRGKNEQNWTKLDSAVTDDYFDDETQIWELNRIEGAGWALPSTVPVKALGKQISPDVPKDFVKEVADMSKDDIAAHILASCGGVNWELFELEPPAVEKKDDDDDEEEEADEDEAPKKSKGAAKKAVQEEEDDEEEEAPPPKKKKAAPPPEDAEEEEEAPPPKKKKAAPPPEDDEEEEAPPAKKKKAAPPPDEEEDEAPPPKKKKAAPPPEEEEEVPPPKKKKVAPPPEDDEEETPPPKKKKAAPPPEDDEEEEEAPPPKKKKAAPAPPDDEEEDEYVPPPKKRDKLRT